MDSVLIPGYKIERELGQGGMARVYLAMHDRLQRPVALKVMAMHLLDDPQYGERFLREARIVARLTHPNIVHVYDVDRFENYHYIAMEFIRGGSLTDRARAGIGVKASLRTIKQIASALDYAHEEGCIHRDVKPDNILFRNDTTAVLSDFGIAKDDSRKTRVTQSGLAVGTPHYMSPEQARGKPVDGRSDFYALGVMLFELLEGHVPFDGETSVAIGIKHITEPVPRLLEDHALLQPLIDWMLEKDPIKRVPNGTAVIEAIEQLEKDPAFQALTQNDPVEKVGKNSGARSGLQAQTHSGDQHSGLASGVQPKASDPAAATSAVEPVAPPPGTVVVPIGEIAGLQQAAPAPAPVPPPAPAPAPQQSVSQQPAQPSAPQPSASQQSAPQQSAPQQSVSQPVPVVAKPTPPPTEPARPVSSPTIGIDAAEVASRTPPPQTVLVEPVPEARVTPPPKRSASGTSHMASVSDAALAAVHPPGTTVMGALQPGADNWQGANPARTVPAAKRSPVAIAIAACVLVAVAGVAFVLMQPNDSLELSSTEQVASQPSTTDADSSVAQTAAQPTDEIQSAPDTVAVTPADTVATVATESAISEPVKTVTPPVKEAEPAKVEPAPVISKPSTEAVAATADNTAKQVTRLLTTAGAAEKNHQYDAAFKAYGDAIKLEGKQGKANRQRSELITRLIDDASQALVADNVGETKSLLAILQREAPKRPAVQSLSDNLNNKLADQEAELAAQNARASEIERLLQSADNKLNSAPATVAGLQQAVGDYDKVLALDPEERRAKKGKRDVLDKMASQANEAANALDVAAVGSWLTAIERLDGSSSQAARTRALLASTQQAVKKRDEDRAAATAQAGEAAKLNNMATALQQQMSSSRLTDADFNRLEKSLVELKKADSRNAVYPQMRNALADAYYRAAKSEFDQGGSRRAESLIGRGLKLVPKHGNMMSLRQQMEAIEAKKKEDVAQPIVF